MSSRQTDPVALLWQIGDGTARSAVHATPPLAEALSAANRRMTRRPKHNNKVIVCDDVT